MTECMLNDLCLAKKGDKAASERLVEDNSGLIWSVARRFFGAALSRTICISSAASASLKPLRASIPGSERSFRPMPCRR